MRSPIFQNVSIDKIGIKWDNKIIGYNLRCMRKKELLSVNDKEE